MANVSVVIMQDRKELNVFAEPVGELSQGLLEQALNWQILVGVLALRIGGKDHAKKCRSFGRVV